MEEELCEGTALCTKAKLAFVAWRKMMIKSVYVEDGEASSTFKKLKPAQLLNRSGWHRYRLITAE